MKKWSIVLVFAFVAILAACGTSETTKEQVSNADYAEKVKENPIVTITMANDEKVVLELYPKVAPNTVANFVSLAKEGKYNGLIFHRVIPGFMIQGGDPSGDGTGGPGYTIDGEFSNNDFTNDLKHERGVISMARSGDPNSAGSQFFIMVKASANLDGDYAAFGKVTKGMDVVDTIVNAPRDKADKPNSDQVMKKVEVDTKGFDYPAPVTNK
ncbi:peptidylprolyl isomerase [Kurthia sp. Dielmo]|uniref:peptidylprolyl isomerase n=1 Tax=Kurthia sp. Dielmo TaxID=1033738 RepID=UPI00112286BA|nr:peptidylprolyl isomerase [Kurthia sp. Dielmo]